MFTLCADLVNAVGGGAEFIADLYAVTGDPCTSAKTLAQGTHLGIERVGIFCLERPSK